MFRICQYHDQKHVKNEPELANLVILTAGKTLKKFINYFFCLKFCFKLELRKLYLKFIDWGVKWQEKVWVHKI